MQTAHPNAVLVDPFFISSYYCTVERYTFRGRRLHENRGTATVYHTHEQNPREKHGEAPPPRANKPAPPTQDNPRRAPRHSTGAGLRTKHGKATRKKHKKQDTHQRLCLCGKSRWILVTVRNVYSSNTSTARSSHTVAISRGHHLFHRCGDGSGGGCVVPFLGQPGLQLRRHPLHHLHSPRIQGHYTCAAIVVLPSEQKRGV